MANRHAPYKSRYLSREPKTLLVKFTCNANASTAQTLVNGNATVSGPFNQGVVNVVTTANTGEYKVALGASANQRDPYRYFAGVDFVSSATDDVLDYVSNTTCNHATDPNISFYCADSDASAAFVADDETVYLRLHFVDSVA